MRKKLFTYIKKNYKASPEYPWSKYATSAVFRHSDNKKWFALVMDVSREKLGLPEDNGDSVVTAINFKVDDPIFRDMIIQEDGIMPAYLMNKQHWITVLLDGTVPEERVYELLEMSYLATAPKAKKAKERAKASQEISKTARENAKHTGEEVLKAAKKGAKAAEKVVKRTVRKVKKAAEENKKK